MTSPHIRSLLLGCLSLAFVWIFTASAHAATYYVSTSGDDYNSCSTSQSSTPSNAKRNIMNAIPCLSAGDTLYIRAGTYNESVNNDYSGVNYPTGTSWSNAVTIAGYPGERPNIAGGITIRENPDGSPAMYMIFDNLACDKGAREDANTDTNNCLYIREPAHHIRILNSDFGYVNNNAAQFAGGSFLEILNTHF